ncbi:MAG: hypothetical protein PHT33_09105 [bacterium]|nr:hypothetical protein [bacterium]
MISLPVALISLASGLGIGMLGLRLLHVMTSRFERQERFSYAKAVAMYFGRFLFYIVGLLAAALWLHLNPVIMLAGIALVDTMYVIANYRKLQRKGTADARRH